MKHLHRSYDHESPTILAASPFPPRRNTSIHSRTSTSGQRQAGRLSLPRYFITWSGHVQACVQDWPSRNRGVFPAVDHDRSRT
jgi:hypothetical protein